MFWETVLKWLVPFVCGAVITFVSTVFLRIKALKNGVQCLLRAEIIRSSEKYTERNEIPLYAKEAIDRAYKAYHALGGNDVATELYKDLMTLPTKK